MGEFLKKWRSLQQLNTAKDFQIRGVLAVYGSAAVPTAWLEWGKWGCSSIVGRQQGCRYLPATNGMSKYWNPHAWKIFQYDQWLISVMGSWPMAGKSPFGPSVPSRNALRKSRGRTSRSWDHSSSFWPGDSPFFFGGIMWHLFQLEGKGVEDRTELWSQPGPTDA
jgi:hypothetical protein